MQKNATIDAILSIHKNVLAHDFKAYHNHVYRVFNFCLLQDSNPKNVEKYAVATAFHDLAIWTHNTFDYLSPSIQLATEYLQKSNKNLDIEEIGLMIDLHHKVSVYKGEFSTVEIFRKADWIDVSMGIMTFDLNKTELSKLKKAFPYYGFHWFLVKKTMRNLVKNPLNPLPMFKK